MSRYLVFGILLFNSWALRAQITVSGKIVNKEQNPIPFTHIRIEGTSSGTVTNANGIFQLTCNSCHTDSLEVIISAIGYKTKRISLSKRDHKIVLEENVLKLKEVSVIPRDYALELIENVIKSIPNNYPAQDERHTGFLREKTTWEGSKNPIYVAESVIEAVKTPYLNKNTHGHIKLNESRKYESTQLDTLPTKIIAGSHHVHRFDVVARREEFLSHPDRFTFEISDTTTLNNQNVYKIKFDNRSNPKGFVYIMDSSFAIVKAEFGYSSSFPMSHQVFGKGRTFLNYEISYEQSEDRKWRYKQSLYKTAFKKKHGLLNLFSEYAVTDIVLNQEDIPYLDRIHMSDALLEESRDYNPNFWDNYNIIIPESEVESLFNRANHSIRNNKKQKTSAQKIQRFFSKVRLEYALGYTPINVQAYSLTYSNQALQIQQNESSYKINPLNLLASIQYEIIPKLYLGLLSEGSFTKDGLENYDILISRDFNIHPKGRPVYLSPGLRIGYQKLNSFLGNYASIENFNVNNETFNSGKTDVYLSEKNFHLQPTLSISIEKSPRVHFLISTNFNLKIIKELGLSFEETNESFFTKERTFLKNGRENLIIRDTDNLFQNSISVNSGILVSF
ncbi:MAG: carboxypeptidase-like regulatory domain-containing protein [Cyclobacteriaceae bacterium]